MPQFQGSLDTIADSNRWARERRRDIFGPNVEAIARAYADAGREMPQEALARTTGARDLVQPAS
jgi:limonene 1,2-monooxygenase